VSHTTGLADKMHNLWAAVFLLGIPTTHIVLSVALLSVFGFELAEDVDTCTMMVCVAIWLVFFVPMSFIVYFYKVYLYARNKYRRDFLVEYLLPQ